MGGEAECSTRNFGEDLIPGLLHFIYGGSVSESAVPLILEDPHGLLHSFVNGGSVPESAVSLNIEDSIPASSKGLVI